jgi:type II secretory pathway pseudopilin PulG
MKTPPSVITNPKQRIAPMFKRVASGVTIIELVVVVLIIATLATIATPVLVGQVTRAKIAATADTIRQLEIAIARYEIDLGEFPPSGTATNNTGGIAPFGNSYLMEALLHSTGGNVNAPSSPRWAGPYIEFDEEVLLLPGVNGNADQSGVDNTREIQLIDPFESVYTYYRSVDYETVFATELPDNHPFFSTETFFNPRTVQIWSSGPNMITNTDLNERGREFDDINNF